MTDNESSSELLSGRIALETSPVVGVVVCASWVDVLTSYQSNLHLSMVESLKNQCVHFFGIVRVCACKCGRSCSQDSSNCTDGVHKSRSHFVWVVDPKMPLCCGFMGWHLL